MKRDKIVYRLLVEDILLVAQDEIQRELSKKEIELIQDLIPEKMNWYDAIAEVIREKIGYE